MQNQQVEVKCKSSEASHAASGLMSSVKLNAVNLESRFIDSCGELNFMDWSADEISQEDRELGYTSDFDRFQAMKCRLVNFIEWGNDVGGEMPDEVNQSIEDFLDQVFEMYYASIGDLELLFDDWFYDSTDFFHDLKELAKKQREINSKMFDKTFALAHKQGISPLLALLPRELIGEVKNYFWV